MTRTPWRNGCGETCPDSTWSRRRTTRRCTTSSRAPTRPTAGCLPEALPAAKNLRWLQSPFAAPFPGYYYEGLIEHPVVVTNARGIYSDHIAHHILMFMLALSRGLPYWMEAQRERRWDQGARKRGYVNVVGSTVLINGVGGIGAETARLCVALGSTVVGIDPRPEHDFPGDVHPPSALDDLLARRPTSWSPPRRTRRRPSSCGTRTASGA